VAKSKSEKTREPGRVGATQVLPTQLKVGDRLADETGEWEVIGPPYTTAGGKDARVRVQRVGKARRHRDPGLARARARQREASDRRGGQAMMRLRLGSRSERGAYLECVADERGMRQRSSEK
jgi:hypothetical protein